MTDRSLREVLFTDKVVILLVNVFAELASRLWIASDGVEVFNAKLKKMKIYIIVILMLLSVRLSAQAIPKPTPMPAKVFSTKPITFVDPARENPVLVLHGNNRLFVKNEKTVIDTLSRNARYRVMINTDADSIKRYSNSKFVRKVVVITPQP